MTVLQSGGVRPRILPPETDKGTGILLISGVASPGTYFAPLDLCGEVFEIDLGVLRASCQRPQHLSGLLSGLML